MTYEEAKNRFYADRKTITVKRTGTRPRASLLPLAACTGLLALGGCRTEAASDWSAVSPAQVPTLPSAPDAAPAPLAEPPMPDDVARAVGFLANLPPCASGAARGAVDVETALAAGATSAQSVRGRLVPRGGGCTAMRCTDLNRHDLACCNHCVGVWAMKSKDGTKSMSIEPPWAVMDCHLGAFRAKAGAASTWS